MYPVLPAQELGYIVSVRPLAPLFLPYLFSCPSPAVRVM